MGSAVKPPRAASTVGTRQGAVETTWLMLMLELVGKLISVMSDSELLTLFEITVTF